MQLRLRLVRTGAPTDDVVITTDGTATVGQIAATIRGRDPLAATAGYPPASSAPTLGVVEADGRTRMLDAELPLGEDDIAPGARIRVIARGGVATAPQEVRAVIRVLAGPDAGREYPLNAGATILGRGPSAQVSLSDAAVSQRHARLEVGDAVELVDLNSANGLLIDGEYVTRARLVGDERIVAGGTEFMVIARPGPAHADTRGVIRFNRAPRVEARYIGKRYDAPEIPVRPDPAPFPWIAMLAPLLIGVAFVFVPGSTPFRFLFIALAPVVLIGTFAARILARRRAMRIEGERFELDLGALERDLARDRLVERSVRAAEAPPLSWLIEAIRDRTTLLWTRRREHWSFLHLRLATGTAASRNSIDGGHSARGIPEHVERLRAVADAYADLDDIPIVEDLRSAAGIGIAGSEAVAIAATAALLVQAVALHAPEDLAVAAIVAERRSGDLEWLKWLPHVGGPHAPFAGPALADSAVAAAALLTGLESLIESRSGASGPKPVELGPIAAAASAMSAGGAVGEQDRAVASGDLAAGSAVVVLIDDDAPADRWRLVRLLETGPAAGVYVVWLAGSVEALPAACRTYLDIGAPMSADSASVDVGLVRTGERYRAVVDLLPPSRAAAAAAALARIVDAGAITQEHGGVPSSVTLGALLGPELLRSSDAILERWQENDSVLDRTAAPRSRRPVKLRAVVGQGASGALRLDLRAQGPHALVGGTTGAGKSEFLQAWVLGMAAELGPDRLTFLFVDYKGGSAFADCVDLPHCVGIVTDLDTRLVARALTSLRAELQHRERRFAERGHKDLADFEASGDPDCPPVLVIVIDEFAALVGEVPAFVDGVVDIAQRGRSLGIHLIMATQRPAGVIKEGIRANTNLRVALRMADAQDSVDVVGAPIAAGFDPETPGRAVVASGNARRTVFQAAFAGARSGTGPIEPDVRIEPLRFGIVQAWPASPPGAGPESVAPKDIAAFVAAARGAAASARIPAPRRPWLDALADTYDLSALGARSDDEIVFGVVDAPAEQQQLPAIWRPDVDGNLAVFGVAGSGKSALLRTIVASAALGPRCSPLQVYGIDFTAQGLSMLEALPHVGSIVDGDDVERVQRLVTMLVAEVARRADAFAKARAGSLAAYRRVGDPASAPRILLLIDGMADFRQAYEMNGSPVHTGVRGLMVDGPKVGIHLLLTADRPSAVPPAFVTTIGRRVALRLADEHDARWLAAPLGLVTPASPPGRGALDGLEFQAAILSGTAGVASQTEAVESLAMRLRSSAVPETPPVRRLPVLVEAARLPNAPGLATIGIADDSLEAVGIAPEGVLLVTGPPGSGRTTALATIVRATAAVLPRVRFAHFGTERSPIRGLVGWDAAAASAADVSRQAKALVPSAMEMPERDGPLVLVIEGVADFLGNPSDAELLALVRAARRSGHFVIAEGEVSTLMASWPGLAELKSARRGLVLHPDTLEAEALFRTPVQKARGPIVPGRGVLVERGRARALQIARWD